MRGKIWKKVSALAAAVCLMLSMMPTGVHAGENTEGTDYVALGDSISSGYGLTDQGSAFPSVVAGTCGLTLSNQAVPGATSSDLFAGLQSGSLNVAGADVITITIGGNDLMGALYTYLANKYNEQFPMLEMTAEEMQEKLVSGDVTVLGFASTVIEGFSTSEEANQAITQFVKNLTGIVGLIRTVNKDAMLIMVNQYNPYAYLAKTTALPQAVQISEAFEAGVAVLNSVINQSENMSGCFVADAYSAIAGAGENPCNASYTPPLTFNLDFHPNEYGHQLIAESVSAAVSSVQQVSEALDGQIAAIRKVTALNAVDQKDVKTAEEAKVWAESLITPALITGVTANVEIVDYQAAQAGTEEDADGTDGSFQISVTLNYGEYVLEDALIISTQIKASAYTASVKDPVKDDDTESDESKTQETQKDEKPATEDTKTENTKAEDISAKSPATGDAADVMPYVIILLAAGMLTAAAIRRRTEGK